MRQPVIINVRGTSGAGKTTLINEILGQYPVKTPVVIPGRKQPLYYILSGREGQPDLALLGHYESPCGGCDTIGKWIPDITPPRIIDGEEPNSYHLTFGLVRKFIAEGKDVVFEGLLLSGDVRHTKALYTDGLALQVVCINIPVDDCIASVKARRTAAGNTKEFNEKNTRDKHTLLQKCITKLREAGVKVHDCSNRGNAKMWVFRALELALPE